MYLLHLTAQASALRAVPDQTTFIVTDLINTPKLNHILLSETKLDGTSNTELVETVLDNYKFLHSYRINKRGAQFIKDLSLRES